jgi:CubicO group peptidase (beta-lactamase class C family)
MRISRRRFTALLAAGIPFAEVAFAQAACSGLTGRQRDAAERLLLRLVENQAVPGISYSIGDASATLAQGAFGLRMVHPSESMQPATRCALASVSKQFVSAAIFLLQQRGKASLGAFVSEYLPNYADARDMTLTQLLTMRAGVPADDEVCEASIGGRLNSATLIANLNRHKLDFSPGKHYSYSNCGYDVAGAVVERISGMSYARFIAENFFEPLGMHSSYVLGSRADANFAQGYARENGRWHPAPPSAADRAFATGNLVSTADDMQRWNRSLLNTTILSRASLREMFTVPTTAGPAHMHYAAGWFVEPSGAIWHGGTLAGYGTVNFLVPSTGYAIVLLSNTAPSDRWKPADVARELYNAAALGPPLPPLLPRTRATSPVSS